MKKTLLFALLFCFGISTITYAQTPVLNWQTVVGGLGIDHLNVTRGTTDGGAIAAGWTYSSNGDGTGNHGAGDGLVVKLSSTGSKQWVKVLGGTGSETLQSILQAADGGYVVVGTTASTDGDLSGVAGTGKLWVVKLNSSGALQWQKRFDGYARSIIKCSDGNYVIAGGLILTGGDNDGLLIKIAADGTLIWQKSFGGSGADEFFSVNQTADGGYVAGGSTKSSSVASFHGMQDYWIVKTDANGDIAWEKGYGGLRFMSQATVVLQTSDGGYFLAGKIVEWNNLSSNGDVANYLGNYDIWALRLTSAGAITWQKTLGGAGYTVCNDALYAADGGFILAGATSEKVSKAHGSNDFWLTKLSSTGSTLWQLPLGGSYDDEAYSITQVNSCRYVVAGSTQSTGGQVTNNSTGQSGWVVAVDINITPAVAITSDKGNSICSGTSVTFTAAPTNGGAAPAYQWKKNGTNVGTNSATYTTAALADGDVIAAVLTSNADCTTTATATSNGITMSVNSSPVTPSVTIASDFGNVLCKARPITFTATPVNGGPAPAYQWKKNSVNVGTNSATYSDAALAGGDVISVVMTSNSSCVTTPTATSNSITMVAGTTVTSSVSITVSPNSTKVYAGDTRTFTAVPVNGGPSPQYTWYRGDNVVATGSTYTTNAFSGSGAEVRVEMVPNDPCTTTPLTAAAMHLTVYPPPTDGKLLSSIDADDLVLTPVSGSATYNYQVTVPDDRTSVDLLLRPSGENVNVGVDRPSSDTPDGYVFVPLVLDSTTTVVNINVRSADELYFQTYKITFTRPVSSDATLSGLMMSNGVLSPAFAKNTTAYTTSLSTSVTSITLTPTVSSPSATIKVNGVSVASGSASSAIPLATGDNNINVVVTAEDGTTTKTYTLDVYRALAASTDATLSNLTISKGTLNPAFSKTTTAYSVMLATESSSFSLTPTVSDPEATVKVNGTTVASGSSSPAATLAYGHNTFNVVVTAADATTTETYAVDVYRAPVPATTDADLYGLTLNRGTLSPAFSGSITAYTVTLKATIPDLKVTPATASNAMTIKVNGKTVANGASSNAITMVPGHNIINIVVTASNGTTTKQYQIDVNNPTLTLSSLAISHGTLSPAFASNILTYSASVTTGITSLTLTPTLTNSTETVKVNGVAVASGTASAPIPIHAGSNVISAVVNAESATATKTYTLTVNRPVSSNAVLSQILTNPNYHIEPTTGTADYDRLIKVPKSVTSITVAATPQHAYATVTINGHAVAAGAASPPIFIGGYNDTVVHIVVTAENGTTQKTYDLHIERPSDNAFFRSIETDPDYRREETTGPADFNRVMTVPWHVTSMRFAATPQHAAATVKVNGSTVANGVLSNPVSLSGLTTVVNIVVTAEDKVTTKTLAITVNRNPSENAVLASIITNPHVSLTATTGPADYNRSASVSSGVSSITFAAVPQNTHASITINGSAVANGVASAPIALSTGPNTVNIVVTAEDGVTVKTYAITVTRAASFMMASKNTGDGLPNIRLKEDREDAPAEQAGLLVRQGLSPNGDGINDRLAITGINAYPDNTVKVMNRSGDVIYQAKGYDNTNVAFDGRNSKGVLQQPGTYFYSVEYKEGSQVKHKTGYLVIKY